MLKVRPPVTLEVDDGARIDEIEVGERRRDMLPVLVDQTNVRVQVLIDGV
jgi:hypothetical protein